LNKLFLVFAITLVLVVGILAQQEVFAKSNQVYNDPINNISMEYPEDWTVIELEDSQIRAMFVPSVQISDEVFRAIAMVGVENLPPEMDLFDYSEIIVQTFQATIEDFDIIESYETALDQIPAQKLKFSARSEGIPVVGTAIWTIKDSKGYFILFMSTPKDFREYSEIARSMEESFQINGNSDDKSHNGQIPAWIKSTARWWADGSITNNDFADNVQLMIDEKIINTPELPGQELDNSQQKVPSWIRNNAMWWVEGLISEDEFVAGVQYLTQQGIIKVK